MLVFNDESSNVSAQNDPWCRKRCPRMVYIINNRASHPQSVTDPGTTKLLHSHKGPPGQKCPRGWRVKKREEDQNQGLDLETAAAHQCSGRYGAVQGPLWQESPSCWVQRCAVTKLDGSCGGGGEGLDRRAEGWHAAAAAAAGGWFTCAGIVLGALRHGSAGKLLIYCARQRLKNYSWNILSERQIRFCGSLKKEKWDQGLL